MKVLNPGVPVMGVVYLIREGTSVEFPSLKDCDGYCDTSTKEIVVSDMIESKGSPNAKGDLARYQRKVIRHELTHALLFESGLSCNSWAENEEVVDWIAIQFPKLQTLFNSADSLKDGD